MYMYTTIPPFTTASGTWNEKPSSDLYTVTLRGSPKTTVFIQPPIYLSIFQNFLDPTCFTVLSLHLFSPPSTSS